ncbi:unnamed protein product, partial [Ectocarpus sp. 13 AM-2016]
GLPLPPRAAVACPPAPRGVEQELFVSSSSFSNLAPRWACRPVPGPEVGVPHVPPRLGRRRRRCSSCPSRHDRCPRSPRCRRCCQGFGPVLHLAPRNRARGKAGGNSSSLGYVRGPSPAHSPLRGSTPPGRVGGAPRHRCGRQLQARLGIRSPRVDGRHQVVDAIGPGPRLGGGEPADCPELVVQVAQLIKRRPQPFL